MATIPELQTSPTSNVSSVERLAAVPLEPRSRPHVLPRPADPQVERETRINAKIAHDGKVLAIMNTVAKILAIRFYLFVVLVGAFILGLNALEKGTWIALSILIAYAVLTVLPLCSLDAVLHRRPE